MWDRGLYMPIVGNSIVAACDMLLKQGLFNDIVAQRVLGYRAVEQLSGSGGRKALADLLSREPCGVR